MNSVWSYKNFPISRSNGKKKIKLLQNLTNRNRVKKQKKIRFVDLIVIIYRLLKKSVKILFRNANFLMIIII
jgi:hypothetical protein